MSSSRLLDGLRVLDLAGEPAAIAGRILSDLGADVTLVMPPASPPAGEAIPGDPWSRVAWSAGKRSLHLTDDDPALGELLSTADVVIDTPFQPGTHHLDPSAAPHAVWVSVTPFGLDGPRSSWRATDLGVMAASGNMYCTGDPDRAPLRCAEPAAYAHTGPEAAFAALTAIASGLPQLVDVSMQEAVMVANMGAAGRFGTEGDRGRRRGARIGRTREIWPTLDGFVSFGIRGGKARVQTWKVVEELVSADGLDASPLAARDWESFNHNTASDEDLEAISSVLANWFSRHTMTELYALACEHNLTLAPVNSPREILASAQLEARGFFGPYDGVERFPLSFVQLRSAEGNLEPAAPPHPSRDRNETAKLAWRRSRTGDRAWQGTTIVELGSGAAGPIATRYFAEHGATVVRVESRSRPDFLRVYALGPSNPHGLDGAAMFDSLNCGKLGITVDLKHPEGRRIALALVQQADAVAENFAPKALKGLGLDYASLAEHKADLVMISACLNGQTGPHRDYPGFGGQGAALAGFNWLTGWPDREPVGPYGTITDSLAPRFAAAALAAALIYRRRTGRGVYLDLSQVEAGTWSLTPWLLRFAQTGEVAGRMGNRSRLASPHGAFPCAGDDRWIAIAVWNDREWDLLANCAGIDDPTLSTLASRLERVDEVERLVARWTATQDASELASRLQDLGLEAVPVQDFGDCFADPQLLHRRHYQELSHPKLGAGFYERNGFRLGAFESGYTAASPLLGEHTDQVLSDLLGLSHGEISSLRHTGALT